MAFIKLAAILLLAVGEAREIAKEYPARACKDMCAYIEKKGSFIFWKHYKCECHNIISPDGFEMQTARIHAHGQNATREQVFLMHGFLTSGMDWVVQPKASENLAFMLADAGYDVWLGNARGNTFSTANSKLDINTEEFWEKIDADEMADLDVPAILDYVLTSSVSPKMHWVGHSQGGGIIVQALAEHPELQKKLGKVVLLAPGVHMHDINVPLLKSMSNRHIDEWWYNATYIPDIRGMATHRYYFAGPKFQQLMHFFTARTPLCRLSVSLCNNIGKVLGINVGDSHNLDPKTMADAYSFDPGGASLHLLMHWAQRVRVDEIRHFDWGSSENPKHYNGSVSAPLYGLSKIRNVEFALYDGGKDLFITPPSVRSLLSEIGDYNSVQHTTFAEYAHMDFVWGRNAHEVLYLDVLRFLQTSSDVRMPLIV